MHIVKVTFRNRNDFHFEAYCRHCGKTSRHGDGYADAYYQEKVFPARHCEHCGKNETGAVLVKVLSDSTRDALTYARSAVNSDTLDWTAVGALNVACRHGFIFA